MQIEQVVYDNDTIHKPYPTTPLFVRSAVAQSKGHRAKNRSVHMHTHTTHNLRTCLWDRLVQRFVAWPHNVGRWQFGYPTNIVTFGCDHAIWFATVTIAFSPFDRRPQARFARQPQQRTESIIWKKSAGFNMSEMRKSRIQYLFTELSCGGVPSVSLVVFRRRL